MISEKPATRPWESVSTDLFKWEGDDYLLVVDSYSHFIEIAKLNNTTSQTVVMHTKSILARHGIARTVKNDNGPQYTAEEYKKFIQVYYKSKQTRILKILKFKKTE